MSDPLEAKGAIYVINPDDNEQRSYWKAPGEGSTHELLEAHTFTRLQYEASCAVIAQNGGDPARLFWEPFNG